MKWKKLGMGIAVLLAVGTLAGCGAKTVKNEQITLDLSFGQRAGTYTGEVNETSIPNGKGKFVSKNSSGMEWTYEGQFKEGHFDGKGKTEWPAIGVVKEGTYKNDRLNGEGRMYKKNGDKTYEYKGNFTAGLPMESKVIELNQQTTFDDWTYKATKVETQDSIGNRQAGGKYILVTVDETNNGDSARQPGADSFFMVVDKTNGDRYSMDTDASLALMDVTDDWSIPWILSSVGPGETADGIVYVFDIPKDADLSNYLFLPTRSMGGVAPIQLAEKETLK